MYASNKTFFYFQNSQSLIFVIHVIVLLFDQSLVHNVAIYSSISQKKEKKRKLYL